MAPWGPNNGDTLSSRPLRASRGGFGAKSFCGPLADASG